MRISTPGPWTDIRPTKYGLSAQCQNRTTNHHGHGEMPRARTREGLDRGARAHWSVPIARINGPGEPFSPTNPLKQCDTTPKDPACDITHALSKSYMRKKRRVMQRPEKTTRLQHAPNQRCAVKTTDTHKHKKRRVMQKPEKTTGLRPAEKPTLRGQNRRKT